MVFDGNDAKRVSDTLEADVLIVGAGTLGLYLAARLISMNPDRRIYLVESGNRITTNGSNFRDSQSIGMPHVGTHHGRFSGLGGTSPYWGGLLAEFEYSDFEADGSPWPISHAEMKHYYSQVYHRLGLSELIHTNDFDRIFESEPVRGEAIESYYTYRLRRKDLDFSEFFRKEVKSHRTRIISNTTAFGLEFDGTRARVLTCRTTGGRTVRIRANKFVFAAGTLAIAQFFLTTQALQDVPWKHNGNIGQYFHDHLAGIGGRVILEDEEKYRNSFERRIFKGVKVERKLKLKTEHRKKLLNGVVATFMHESVHQQHIEHFKSIIPDILRFRNFSLGLRSVGDLFKIRSYLFSFASKLLIHKRIHEAFDRGISVYLQVEQIPYAQSRILISQDTLLDNGLFKIHVDWNWSGREIDAIHTTLQELDAYMKGRGLGYIEIDPDILGKNPEILKNFRDTNHHCGGMRMSERPEDGVVDTDCRVWGTDNVWVAGAAVFPTSSHANSVLTALALTERMAQHSI